ncbi:MAG: hypothetical protein AVDCRST_MAG93-6643, partial [uncultured Chloroflexia bacterium]
MHSAPYILAHFVGIFESEARYHLIVECSHL